MPRHFDPRLINDPFGDPGLYVNLVFERRALVLAPAQFSGRLAFARAEGNGAISEGGVLLQEPGFLIRATTIDHGIPALAFALEERAHVDIWRNKVEAMGLAVGPRLGAFKEAILRGSPEAAPVEVTWAGSPEERPKRLPLGVLKKEITRIAAGRTFAYVVDCSFTDANVARIISLAKDADILFIEAVFLQADSTRAAERLHLTAPLARQANVKRLVTLHYSPRHQGRGDCLAREAEAAFKCG